MPFGFRIHSGTVNIVACDIDGYASPAIQAIGDTATCTVNVVDTITGATRYNSSGSAVGYGNAAIQASKQANVAPDRVNLHLTRVQIDPAVQSAMGQSIRVGSSVIDQFTQVDTSFVGVVGSPLVQVFEDFPTVSATSIASDEAFGTSTVKRSNPIAAAGIASPEAFGSSSVAHALVITAIGIPSAEIFGFTAVTLAGSISAISIQSDEAFGASLARSITTLAATGVPSAEIFGTAVMTRLVPATSIATAEAFGTSTIRLNRSVAAISIASSEVFGFAAMGVSRMLHPSSIPSSEAFGASTVVVGEPPAGAAPELVTPGRLAPSGDGILTGTVITASVGEWTGYPHETRTVWLRDATPILDTGWRTEVWTDTYTVQPDDVGHVVTAQQQVRNSAGASDQALAQGQIHALLRSLPPAFVDHTAVFGPIISVSDVWRALQSTLKLWLPTYLRERERLSGRAYATLKGPRGWRVFTEAVDSLLGDQFPLCVIVAPGIADPLLQRNEGLYSAVFEMGVSIVVKARDVSETIDLANQYGAAVRKLLLDHGSLGGIASGLTIIGERYDELPDEDQRTIVAAEVVVSIRVDDIARAGGGPLEPEPEPEDDVDPGGPTLGTVATTVLDLERV